MLRFSLSPIFSYDADQGSIAFNGVDIRELTHMSLRALSAVVPQEAILFNDRLSPYPGV